MDILHAMTTFIVVCDHMSFARAAEALGTSGAAVSRQVAALEEHVGARLIHRTTRRLSLTDAGQDYAGRARQILADIAEAEAAAGEGLAEPSGLLRVSAPLSYGINRLSRWLPAFLAAYPKLKLDLDLSDRQVDLASDGIDVAVRIALKPASTNVITRKVGDVRSIVCASPAYLKARGVPQQPDDLASHDLLAYSHLSSGDHWHFRKVDGSETSVRFHPRVHATNGDMLCELAAKGAGIVNEPDFMVERHIREGCLVPILPEWTSESYHVHALYLSRKFLSAKIRVFIDHLVLAEQGNRKAEDAGH